MFCQYCKEANKQNAFTTGCDKFKDTLKKHASTVDHRAALKAKSGRRDMQRAVATAYRDQGNAVHAALCTVYFMMKKNLPNDIFIDLKQFQIMQGGTAIQGLTFQSSRGGRQFRYEHSDNIHGFQEALAAVVEELAKLLEKSSFFSLMVDESTDVATTQTLIVIFG